MIDYITVRNFYSDPYAVRNYALKQKYLNMAQAEDHYGVTANFPGWRTELDNGIRDDFTKDKMEKIVEPLHGKITMWSNPWNGLFQYATCFDKSWIHTDMPGTWAGVLFLTPNPPPGTGTGFFMHKETGCKRRIPDNNDLIHPKSLDDNGDNMHPMNKRLMEEGADTSKWEMIDEISNEFNKLILYRGDYWHSSLKYFGYNIYDSRLFQTFFFTTEDTSEECQQFYQKTWNFV